MLRSIALLSLVASPVIADAPRVVTDISPVHGLVSQVMEGVGEPDLLLRPGQSPHGYALRPSDARKLQQADVVFWVGEGLTPWLEKPLETLSAGAARTALLELGGLPLIAFGEEGHDEHDGDAGHNDHDEHEDHDAHQDHDEHEGGDEHAEEDGDHHDHHDHGEFDPHAWLDPVVAGLWLDAIAGELAEIDPDNAERYRSNAAASQEAMARLDTEIANALAPVRNKPFVAFHDAYGYLEMRYGLNNAGTVSSGDASTPGAARIKVLKKEIATQKIRCGFAEPQFDPELLRVAGESSDLEIAVLDPLGVDLELGPAFYPALLRAAAASLVDCLSDG